MGRTNGRSDVEPEPLDTQHELPASDEGGEEVRSTAQPSAEVPRDAEVQQLRAERDSLIDRLARLQAEFENSRKRAAREQQEFKDHAAAEAIKALLPSLDSFDRALQTSNEKSDLRNGVELIYKQLQDALQKVGLHPVPAKGEPFDPRVHEAIEMVDSSEVKDNHVLDELQRGYKLKDRLLRPAMVRVSRNTK